MTTLAAQRLRLPLNALCFGVPVDILRRHPIEWYRGNSLSFELAVFSGSTLLSVANLASITLEVRTPGLSLTAPNPATAPLMSKTVSDFDDTTTLTTWADGSQQHAVVDFTAEESNIPAGPVWLSIFAITSDDPGNVITLAAGLVQVLEDGSGLATAPLPVDVTFYTAAQSDARFALLGEGGGGGGTWGSIGGTLSNQTDLATALAAKAALAGAAFTGAISVTRGFTVTGSTSLDGLLLANSSAATFGNNAPSPQIHFSGKGFISSASQAVEYWLWADPTPAGATSYLRIDAAVNGGLALHAFRLSTAGDLTVAGVLSGASGAFSSPLGYASGGTGLSSYAAGDMLYASATNTLAKRAIGAVGQVWTVGNDLLPAWADATGGGFTNPMSASGDMIIGGASGAATRLAKGANGQILTLVSGSPAWQTSVTFNNDGSGHFYIGGSGPATLDGGITPLLTINGGFAIVNNQSSTLIVGDTDEGLVGSPCLVIQRNGGMAATGPTDICFASNPHETAITPDGNYGAIFLSIGEEAGGWDAGAIIVTGSPAWLRSAPTIHPTTGVGQVGLSQEWVQADAAATQLANAGLGSTGDYRFRPIWVTKKDFSCFVGDPFYLTLGDAVGKTLELTAPPNSGYAEFKIRGTQSYRGGSGNHAGAIISLWDEDGKFFGVNFLSSTDFYGGTTGMYRKAAANLQTNATDGISINAIAAAAIRFGTNGTERAQIDGSGNMMLGTMAVVGAALLTVAGQIYGTTIRSAQTTVAGLPSAATAGAGARAFVTDANATLTAGVGTTVAGSGSNKVPVYSDGTNWIIG